MDKLRYFILFLFYFIFTSFCQIMIFYINLFSSSLFLLSSLSFIFLNPILIPPLSLILFGYFNVVGKYKSEEEKKKKKKRLEINFFLLLFDDNEKNMKWFPRFSSQSPSRLSSQPTHLDFDFLSG